MYTIQESPYQKHCLCSVTRYLLMLIYLLFPCIAASKAQWARTTNSKRHQRLQAHGPTIRSSKSRSANCNQQRHPSNIATRDIKVTEFFVKLNPIGTWYLRFISPTYNPSMHHSDSQQKKKAVTIRRQETKAGLPWMSQTRFWHKFWGPNHAHKLWLFL